MLEYIRNDPNGMHVLFGVVASVMWFCTWLGLMLAGKFDKLPARGVPVLPLGILLCIPFGALFCALGFLVGGFVAVMWMLNALFGWFGDQMIVLRGAFMKIEAKANEAESEDAEEPEEAPKKRKKKSGKSRKGGR